MWILKIGIWAIAIVLFFVGIFGGVLDVASLIGLSIPQWAAIAIAAGLIALEREIKVLTLNWKLNSRRDLQRRIDKLAAFRKQVITTVYVGTPSANDFRAWVKKYEKWEISLVNYLKKEFPYAVFEMFQDLGVIPAANFTHLSTDPVIQSHHHHYLNMIAKQLDALERLIHEHTGITIEREPGFRELFGSGPTG